MSTELNPLAVSIKNYSQHTIHPLHPTMHGGSVGRVIGVVAAIAIPVFAPTIAASLGVSAAVSTATGIAAGAITTGIGSAITGAAMGAISAAVTGQSISRGALTGGLTAGLAGGIQEYMNPGSLTTTTTGEQVVSAGPNVNPTAATPAEQIFPTSTGPGGLTTADLGVPSSLGTPGVQTAVQRSAAAEATGKTLTEVIKSTGEKIYDKVTTPEVLASATLQAVGQLAASAMVPEAGLPGFSPEEQELVEARRQELEELKTRDIEKYNQQIELSKRYLTQAGFVDPNYYALQSANRSLVLGARQDREQRARDAFDPLGDGRTAGDQSRLDIARQKARQEAFDTGFLQGVGLQNQYLNASSTALPTSNPNYAAGLVGLQNTFETARQEGDKDRTLIYENLAGLNTTTGRDEEEQKKIDDEIAMVGRQSQTMINDADENIRPLLGTNQYNAGLIRNT
jgi:hypothetical protein